MRSTTVPINLPKSLSEVPVSTSLWDQIEADEKVPHVKQVTDTELAQSLFVDKTRLLNAIALMQASIYYRAIRACEMYFEWMHKRKGTETQTYLRPRVRLDSRYMTVEMAWVRRLSKMKPAKSTDKIDPKSKIGRTFQLQTDKGLMTVFTWYEYLKKRAKDRYPESIFKDQPEWVKKLGHDIEDNFELLRKEQKLLNDLKRIVMTIHRLEEKSFTDQVKEELAKWGGDKLQSLYVSSIEETMPTEDDLFA